MEEPLEDSLRHKPTLATLQTLLAFERGTHDCKTSCILLSSVYFFFLESLSRSSLQTWRDERLSLEHLPFMTTHNGVV